MLKSICKISMLLLTIPINADSFTQDSYQNVKIGMSVQEANSILKDYVNNIEDMDDSSCYYLHKPENDKAVMYMIVEGNVTRIDNYDVLTVSTEKSIKIGSSKDDVLRNYKKVEVSPHPYNDEYGEYLEVKLSNGNGIIFETDNNIVVSFRLGSYPSVRYIEGCF